MFSLHQWQASWAEFGDIGGGVHRLSCADLLELAQEGRDPISGQRYSHFGDGRQVPTLIAGVADAGGWRFELDDGSSISVSDKALACVLEPELWTVPQSQWQASVGQGLRIHDYGEVTGDAEARRLCFLQVAQYGFARIANAPIQAGAIECFISHFGTIRPTNYGDIFDVQVKPGPANLADTALALAPHTDNPYRIEPPDLQVLHCLQSAANGGASRLVDGLVVAEHLRAQQPSAFALLCQVPVRFGWSDGETKLAASGPIIALGHNGQVERLRYNPRSFDRILVQDIDKRSAWRKALALFADCLEDQRFAVDFKLGAGDMLVMDNRRVLHGRAGFSAFSDLAEARHLQGAYVDADGLYSALYRLTEAKADRELGALAGLFCGEAMGNAYGEEMSIRDHMLQSAELAVRQSLGGAIVAAALLHDIGWAMAGPHEEASAKLIAPLLGPKVAEPIRLHVAAKRYLVATRRDYTECLSAASRHTLSLQGGAMDAAECANFEASAGFAAAVQLRLLDDAGKDAVAQVGDYASYAGLLHRLAIRYLLGQ